jgi:putative transposase
VRRERCGHLWQDRFYSCVMDSGHTVQAMAYIERNPVRARLVGAPEDWAWSSADVHLNGSDPAGKLDLEFWSRFYTPAQWKLALATSVFEEGWIRRFRSSSERGYAFADEEFIDRFQKDSNRNLRPVKPGPKPGSATVSPPQQLAAAGATGQ